VAFGAACDGCPLAAQCTTAKAGRVIWLGCYEAELVRARTTQADPAWRADYRDTKPKVERKIGHLMRRRHGAGEPGSADRPKSPPTSASLLPQSTWPAAAYSDSPEQQGPDG